MYKIIVVDTTTLSSIEEQLNEAAQSGFHFVGILEMTNRAVIIMEKEASPKRGRPKKIDQVDE